MTMNNRILISIKKKQNGAQTNFYERLVESYTTNKQTKSLATAEEENKIKEIPLLFYQQKILFTFNLNSEKKKSENSIFELTIIF